MSPVHLGLRRGAPARPSAAWKALARSAIAVGAALVLMGHSPYRQWAVYRETHLIVVADGGVPGAFTVSESIARTLAAHVAKSHAVAARASSAGHVVALLRSGQLPLALLLTADATDAALARGAFARDAPLPLRTLAALGPYLLVTVAAFPAERAREIAAALTSDPPEGSLASATPPAAVPLHPALVGGAASRPASGS